MAEISARLDIPPSPMHLCGSRGGFMNDLSRSQRLQANERIKHAVGIATTLANALTIAGFARLAVAPQVDIYALLWLIGAGLLMLAA
jgi:hypothetical protein